MLTKNVILFNQDCGGNVSEKQVYEAFKILTADPQVKTKRSNFHSSILKDRNNNKFLKVKAILVNIFGGIVNCATIANGIVNACKTINLKVPLIVRLQGNVWKNNS